MTYFTFLLRFLVIPILILFGLNLWDWHRGNNRSTSLNSWPAWAAIGLHMFVALVYTTPWDNYLVATKVWWYDPQLVTGIVFGWVPIEEYTFFLLQPILAGLWLLFLRNRLTTTSELGQKSKRKLWVMGLGFLWLIVVSILFIRWRPGTYLALELLWALPPIILQIGFGGDILWKHRRLLLFTLLPLTLYLSGADALAITYGTWTIDPAQSLPFLLGGLLPIEEFLFFFLTNTLCTFGITLILAAESHIRLRKLRTRFQKYLQSRSQWTVAE